jgi:anti-sigma regulatory factor (Ser/Thr protein kinase)
LALVEIVHDDVVPHLMQVESFASFIYARFDLANSRLDIINCGHPYPILCRMREGSCREIGHNGMPMGFIREKNYEQRSYKIESDDAFFFFSDGLTDSLAYRDDDKSKRIIFDSLWSHRNSEPDTQINEILSTLYGGNPEKTFFDDVTCLGVKLAFDAKQLPVIQSSACFTYKLEELELMRKFIKEVYRGANNDILKAKEIPLLEIAATETFTNILKHTSSDNKGLEIELNIEILTDRVILTFAYFGSNPFIELADPLKSEENTGFGLYIIEHMVDQVLYTIDEKGRNCIVLIKKGTRY